MKTPVSLIETSSEDMTIQDEIFDHGNKNII